MKRTSALRVLLVIGVAALVAAFFALDLDRFLTLAELKARRQSLVDFHHGRPLFSVAAYMGIYIAATALSLPGATVLTLAGAAVFGLWTGLVAVSFASTIGATLAFLCSRFLLRDWVRAKFGDRMAAVNRGIEREGAFYLFTLRLVPVFPFFMINLLMGLTSMTTVRYYLVSQVGMLPGTFVYVLAGTQLGHLNSLAGILSPGLLFSFALLGVFPLVAKRSLEVLRARKALAAWSRPKRFDYNLVVIGAGAAGLVTSYIAAAVKAKVALVERHRMGGDCLNTGCVPSKALIRTAKMMSYLRRAREFGIETTDGRVDFPRVMERIRHVVAKVAPHDSVERYTGLGVEVIPGEARITSPWTVEVNGRILASRAIVVASGAGPFVPPIPGLDRVTYLTSDNLWELRELPRRLVVLGGGPIGCEMTQSFARLGSDVTQVEMAPRIMGREDEEISETIRRKFEAEGVRVLTGHRAREIVVENGEKILRCEHKGAEVRVPFDEILVAVGRAARLKGFGLEEVGVEFTPSGALVLDDRLRTTVPTIFAAGDAAGPYQFTHVASHQAWYAAVNALFGGMKSFAVDYRVIPWATFTDPEVARVGLNEREAREKGIAHEVTTYGLDDLDRAIADSEDHGMVKILTRPVRTKSWAWPSSALTPATSSRNSSAP